MNDQCRCYGLNFFSCDVTQLYTFFIHEVIKLLSYINEKNIFLMVGFFILILTCLCLY